MAAPHPGRGLDTLVVGLAAALPALLALGAHGVIETNDTSPYLAYAEALRAGPLPQGEALLRSHPTPALVFRTSGFPLLLAGLQSLLPATWPAALVLLQMAAQAGVAAAMHRVALLLGLGRGAALAVALMPAVGFTVVMQVAVMTDALYGALTTGAALLLLAAALRGGSWRAIVVAGLMLGAATTIREATVFLAPGYLPAAFFAVPRRRWLVVPLLLAPVALAAAAIIAGNAARTGHPVLSTSRQIVMIQAVLPLVARGLPVYDGEDAFDRAARRWVVPQGYAGIDPMLAQLHAEAGLTAPELAAAATDRYWRAWRRHPLEMLRAMMVRFPVKFLAVPFQPVDTLADLERYSGRPRPDFSRLDLQWRRLRDGSAAAGLWIAATVGSRAIGTLVAIAAILCPLVLLRRRDPRLLPLLGSWVIAGWLVAIYLPVHIETRYLIPVVPLLALLGGVAIAAWRPARAAPA